MALFKGKGESLSRANAIVSKYLQDNSEGQEGEPQDSPVEPQDPPVDPVDPPAEPPVEEPTDPPGEENKPTDPPVDPDQIKEPPVEPEPTEPPSAELTDEVIFEYLSEKLKKEVKGYDDLTPKEIEIDPEVKQLLDWKEKTGLSLSKWSDYNKDYSKMGDLEVAREILAQNHPSFTSEEIDYKLKDFIFDEDMDDETDRLKKSIALKEYAQQGRIEFKEKQLELQEQPPTPSLTQEQIDDLEFAKETRKALADSQTSSDEYARTLNETALTLNSLDLKLSDDLTIAYEVPEGDRKTLAKTIIEMPNWYNEDGSLNHRNVAIDGIKVKNFDSMIAEAFNQGRAVGKEEVISGKPHGEKTPDVVPQGGEETNNKEGNISDVISNISGRGKSKLRFGRTE